MSTKTPVGLSMWFGAAPPHTTSVEILFRSTDANGVHTHSGKRIALLDLMAHKDSVSGIGGEEIVDALGRMVRAFMKG